MDLQLSNLARTKLTTQMKNKKDPKSRCLYFTEKKSSQTYICCSFHTKLNEINLYNAVSHSRVGRGNPVLRHSVPKFPPKSEGIAMSGVLPRH